MGIFRSIKYSCRKRSRRAAIPPIFVEALAIAATVFILTHTLGLADLWLHSTTRSILVPIQTPLPHDLSGGHGVAFNQAYCDSWVANEPGHEFPGYESWPCFRTVGGDWAQTETKTLGIGWAMAHNMTVPDASFRVITLSAHNDTAILVPFSTVPLSSSPNLSSISYTFTTTGARSTCTIISKQCTQDNHEYVEDCTPVGYPWLPIGPGPYAPRPNCTDHSCMGSRMFSVINGSIGHFVNDVRQVFPVNATIPPNPVTMLIQLQFFNTESTPLYFWNFDVIDNRQTLFAACELTYLNITAHYDAVSDSFDILDSTLSTPEYTAVLQGPLLGNFASDRLAADMQGTALVSDINTNTALLNQDLSRLAIGWLAGVFEPTSALQSWSVSNAVLGQYPVGPVVAVVGILYIYTLFAIVIFFSSVGAASYSIDAGGLGEEKDRPTMEKRAVVLGQMWLTDALPFVGYVFEGDSKRSVAEDSLNMVQDHDGNRLELGVHDVGSGTKFGLRRRGPAPERVSTDDETGETLDA